MQRKKIGKVEWLEFDLLTDIPHLKHGFFLRSGGYSPAPFDSLNASLFIEDNLENVERNQTLINQYIDSKNLTKIGRGCHDANVQPLQRSSPNIIPDCDGITCNEPGITLLSTSADCQIAFIYDPIHKAIANIHSGWKGNVKNIYAAAVDKMKKIYHSNPADLLVGISPSLGPDVAEFIHYKHELPEEFWQFQIRPTYFDLWSIAEWQLQTVGILPHHIEIARLCTYSNPSDFFSYRRDKITGRHGAVIALVN